MGVIMKATKPLDGDGMMRDVVEGEVLRGLPRAVRRAKLARLLMAGASPARAAELMGLSAEQVRRECRDPQFRRLVLERVEGAFESVDQGLEQDALTLTDQVRLAGQSAFDTLMDLMQKESTNDAVRARIAQDILDRNPDTGKETVIRHELVDARTLQRAHKAAVEMDRVLEMPQRASGESTLGAPTSPKTGTSNE